MPDTPKLLIMAAGTGGHVYPALATAEQICRQGWQVEWLGSGRAIEIRLVPQAGYPLHNIILGGLRGQSFSQLLLAPWRLLRAWMQVLWLLHRMRPQCVLGMGGFIAGPGGLAARMLGIPLVIHEQNAIPGLTNRLLRPLATQVLEAFLGSFKGSGVICTGNPVRSSIMALPQPSQRLAGRTGPVRLLIIGGSLGALALNQVVPAAIDRMPLQQRPQLWHQCGSKHLDSTLQAYADIQVEARVCDYIDNMASAYAWADLVLCRAGALTVSELGSVGLAAVLVPYPFAVDDHQTANAQALVAAGAARILPQKQLTAAHLATLLSDYFGQRITLLTMAQRARQYAHPQAAQAVADVCREVAYG
jgi:UDP-N-acetylglucosamine--N-acetylmuramyl-(pentapeptide) pyrophosphoryl-undecaprenol N-acetylglucosamine transferase